MAEDTIIHHVGEEAAAVPDAVLDAVVSSAHDAGEHAATLAAHGEKLAEHETELATHRDRLEALSNQVTALASMPVVAADESARDAIAELEREVDELKEDATQTVEAVVEPPKREEPSEPPKKKSFWHRFI
jgi:sirohydrochlorin ferrochelatase